MNATNCTALVFQNTTFDVIDQNGHPWLRGPQLGGALGYAKGKDSVLKLYESNKDEFTDSMTAIVKLPTAGGEQETRIFSLRGCHLLAMLSRTKIAKAFRRWVLDILDHETGQAVPLLPQFISVPQLGELTTRIAERFPDGKDRSYAWSRFNNHFRINSYKNLPAAKFDDACLYIDNMPVKKLALPVFDAVAAQNHILDCLTMSTTLSGLLQAKIFRMMCDDGVDSVINHRLVVAIGPGFKMGTQVLGADDIIVSKSKLADLLDML